MVLPGTPFIQYLPFIEVVVVTGFAQTKARARKEETGPGRGEEEPIDRRAKRGLFTREEEGKIKRGDAVRCLTPLSEPGEVEAVRISIRVFSLETILHSHFQAQRGTDTDTGEKKERRHARILESVPYFCDMYFSFPSPPFLDECLLRLIFDLWSQRRHLQPVAVFSTEQSFGWVGNCSLDVAFSLFSF